MVIIVNLRPYFITKLSMFVQFICEQSFLYFWLPSFMISVIKLQATEKLHFISLSFYILA